MTPPRCIESGTEYFFHRGTLNRTYFLRPDPELVEGAWYLLALAALRYNVGIVSAVFMSTHYHGTAIDREGNFPEFLQYFDSLLARYVNYIRGRRDTMWSGGRPQLTRIADGGAAIRAAAYTLTNPVQDGAVSRGRDWPGLRTTPQAHQRPPRICKRPKRFFRQTGPDCLPEEVELQLVRSSFFEDATEFTTELMRAVADLEQDARDENTHGFMGPKACTQVPWASTATTPLPIGPGTTPDPVISRDREAGQALRQLIKDFRAAYAECRRLWVEGVRDLEWPAGTWMMRRLLALPPPLPSVALPAPDS